MLTPDDVLLWLMAQPKRPTRLEMAGRYRDLLLTYWGDWADMPSCAALNNEIISAWSIAGLCWIKREAWKAGHLAREHAARCR